MNAEFWINHIRSKLNIIVLVVFMTGLVACSDSDTQAKGCDAPIDTVTVINELSVNNDVYYLVLRVSGWHDKTESIELYGERPKFDQCANSHVELLFGDSLELDSTVSHIYLNHDKKSLDIEYTPGKPGRTHNASLKLELKPEAK